MNLTYKKKTQTATQWSKELGIPVTTLHNRIARGWTDEKALTTPVDLRLSYTNKETKVTKEDCERFLNDLPLKDFPMWIGKLIPFKANKKGQWLRRHHRKEFDRYFEKDYLPFHENK